MSDQFVGEILPVAFDFAPTGFALCQGQLLPISQNTALFSLLGTYYGGNGSSTFALPDLQGCAPINQGAGPGLSDYSMGQMGGADTVTLIASEMPVHVHTVNATPALRNTSKSSNSLLATGGNRIAVTSIGSMTPLGATTLSPAGGSLPHNNMMPYLAINFVIALQGVFPARS